MNSTWRSVILSLAVSLLIVAISLFVIFRLILPYELPENADEPEFVIAEWEGKVAVFEGNDTFPMQVFDMAVQALPPEEREKVTVGIPVKDADQLSVLLEDYTS